MFIPFGSLGKESQKVISGMIFVVGDRAGHGPKIGVDFEKVHIDRDLGALALEVFRFIHFFHDNHFSVRDRGDLTGILIRNRP